MTTKANGLAVKSKVKGGMLACHNHNQALKLRTSVRAGSLLYNHNQALKLRTNVRAGALSFNHNQGLKIRSGVKAGGLVVGTL